MSITVAWSTVVPVILWAICAVMIGKPNDYDRGGYFGGIADLFYLAGHGLNVLGWLLVLFAWKYFEVVL